MARITFQKAPEDIQPGDTIKSSDMAKLADAFNSRIKSGCGDFVYRLSWAASSVGRNFIIDSPDFAWLGEFMHFDPRINGLVSYPAGTYGTSGGANPGNPFVNFILGNENIEVEKYSVASSGNQHTFTPSYVDYLNEAGRLGYVSTSAANNWILAARQRGAYNPTADELQSPFRAFSESFNVVDFSGQKNGFSETWGGYGPSFPLNDTEPGGGNCQADGTSPYYRFTVKFEKLTAGAPTGLNAGTWSSPYVDFGDFCPSFSDYGTTPYVLGISESATAWTVISFDGTNNVRDRLPKTDYSLVLDGSGSLKHQRLEIAARTLSWIITDARGSDSQRANEAFRILDITFDTDRYFTKQNRLAPAYGTVSGQNLVAVYPEFRLSSTTPGTKFTNLATSGTTHTSEAEFGAAGVYITSTGITGTDTATIIMRVDGEQFAKFTFGADPVIKYFDDPVAGGEVEFELESVNGTFTTIDVEIADLLVETGSWDQLATLLRAGLAGSSYAVDGQPELTDTVKIVSDSFFKDGVMITPAGGPRNLEDNLEESGLWDAARKTFHENLSVVGDGEFYSTQLSGGDTYLEFYRYYNDSPSSGKDLFKHMLPAEEVSSGEIKSGRKYVLLNCTGGSHAGGTWEYDGVTYDSDVTVEGVDGETEFTINTTGYKLFVAEGIYSEEDYGTTIKRGWTNEWVMHVNPMLMDTIGTNPSFQLNDYALNYPLVDRCAVNSPFASSRQKYQFRDPLNNLYKPELPPGYRYDGNLHYSNPSNDFYSSCMVYPKPYMIRSITHGQSAPGVEPDRVIVRIDGRLQHTSTAPSSYGWDPTSWNLTSLTNEAYRTDENAIRERAAERLAGHGSLSKVGDNAYGTTNPTSGSKGARVPQFYFARLIPKPYDDGNDDYNAGSDTLFTADIWKQMELYLRVMCEGWLDPESTTNHDCTSTTISFDYTFDRLCLQAFGAPWLYPVPGDQNGNKPRAFGNYPGQRAWAECFTNICKAVNMLRYARLILPFSVEYEQTEKVDMTELTSPDVMTSGCNSGSQEVLQAGFTPAEATTVDFTAPWTSIPFPSFAVETIASISTNVSECPVSDNHVLRVVKAEVQLRGAPDAAGQLNALEDDLQTHIDEGGVAILAKRTITNNYDTLTPVGSPGVDTVNLGGQNYQITTTETTESEDCVLVTANAELIDPGVPPSGDFYRDGNTTNETRRRILYQFSVNPDPILVFDVVE
jgi:hypothetical protein